ncbi:hypothetical protein G3I59_26060 [Amycolatopsis rubida]|uniref:Condensation domain-containing protein n=1 Tax=Amycolatopsis rubida TaxID=112413 RepID=A0ABX0BTU2_9PSEU|nr:MULTISPECIES: hypothetical protein [Amycolatopsis]MYW93976.1 hypothetical protein [Amycolatopsis rubida]NEC58965.1 hypothetical protein [Amycolatopsis rubida]OAP20595.1 hypothetical protein A4R44_08625 [Amycolatopsis sp. M39]
MTAGGPVPVRPAEDRDSPAQYQVRALRVDGEVDTGRLAAAVREVSAALLSAGPGDGPRLHVPDDLPAGDPETACVAALLAERDRRAAGDPLPRNGFHWLRLAADRHVLGLVAASDLLDIRSVYAVLGAVWQAYFGRFRPSAYRGRADAAGFDPVGTARAHESRRRWWSREFPRYRTGGFGGPDTSGPAGRRRLRIAGDRWTALTGTSGPLGANGSLTFVALLAWCLHTRGRPGSSGFGCEFDLRDYFGLGQVLGPLTDRLAFRVDLDGLADPAFPDVLMRAQTGFLDSVVHYLPYRQLVEHGVRTGALTAPRAAELWNVTVHFCRNPPRSVRTRSGETPGPLGVSIELFREADLLGPAGGPRAGTDDGVLLDVHLGELGDDMVAVFDYARPEIPDAAMDRLLGQLDRAVDHVLGTPAAPLPRAAD